MQKFKIKRGLKVNKKKYKHFLLFFLILDLMWGCCGMSYIAWESNPCIKKVENDYFEAMITPIGDEFRGYKSFKLHIRNKMEKNIEINWNKTLYIKNGQTSGGFIFEGILFKDRNNLKSPDIIFAKSTFSKTIWPSNLTYYSSGQYGGWRHKIMEVGEHGVYLTVMINGNEFNEKMTVKISYVEKESKKTPNKN